MSKYLAILKAAGDRRKNLAVVLSKYGIVNYVASEAKEGSDVIKLKLDNLSKIIYIKKEKDILQDLKEYNISIKI
jgi:hypothetical protein